MLAMRLAIDTAHHCTPRPRVYTRGAPVTVIITAFQTLRCLFFEKSIAESCANHASCAMKTTMMMNLSSTLCWLLQLQLYHY